jgi:benzil reductase ((S)-benzoin forming)
MNYFIITGVSRGIGEAIAKTLIRKGNSIFCVSRGSNPALIKLAEIQGVELKHFQVDLINPEAADKFIHSVFDQIQPVAGDRLALINNAGMIEPIAPSGEASTVILEKHLHLNLLAPMVLSSVFIKRLSGFYGTKVILNISSGAASRPISGWSAYCSSKAALAMFTQVVGLEQSATTNPVHIFALAPGIINTQMQGVIRQADPQFMPEKYRFEHLYKNGLLTDPQTVAEIICEKIFSKQINNGANLTIEQLREME